VKDIEPPGRVVSTVDIPRLLAQLRADGDSVVLTNGCFDVLHAGHVSYLAQARELGDRLIVGLNSDHSVRTLKGPDRPVNAAADRALLLAALSCVDYVTVFDDLTPDQLIRMVQPDIYVKGGDYAERGLPERDLVIELGGRVEILDFVPGRSTTALIEKLKAGPTGL
jgi:rfaE bifunctional protein nucleotidyltransferase chain/domain